jgi:hypothetical protein
MTIHKCDSCGKEISVWINVKTSIGATRNETNVYPLFPLVIEREYCPDCAKMIFNVESNAVFI